MSEASKAARSAMKGKISRLMRTDPKAKVDASGYTPPDALDADVKTGARPVRGRRYKRGGKVMKVEGEHAKHHAGRKPRKSGGSAYATPDNLLNRDVVEANKERAGSKHVGAFKKGGKVHHKDRGGLLGGAAMEGVDPRVVGGAGAGLKHGGKAMKHDDAAEDKKLIKKVVKKDAIKPGMKSGGMAHGEDCRCKKCMGGRMGKGYAAGGSPEDEKDGHEDWRSHDPVNLDSLYGKEDLPSSHSEARKDFEAFKGMGWLKHENKDRFLKKATEHLKNRAPRKSGGRSVSDGEIEGTRPTGGRLARKRGGHAMNKGPTIIKIDVGAHPHGMMGGMPPGMPPRPAGAVPVPVAPPGMMMPPGAPPPMGGGAPPMMPPGLMGRKSGGRVHKYPLTDGSGGGMGRLEKIKAYGLKPA